MQATYNRQLGAKAQRKKKPICQLAIDSWAAFKPYVNAFGCGVEEDDEKFRIRTEAFDLMRRHKRGERGLAFKDGEPFNPYWHFVRVIMDEKKAERFIENSERWYFTSGQAGRGLLYWDVDAHHAFEQPHLTQAVDLLRHHFGRWLWGRDSNRGYNFFQKLDYTRWLYRHGRQAACDMVQALAKRLETAVSDLLLAHGLLIGFEMKGAPDGTKRGSLAKFPFQQSLPYRKRDSWSYPLLGEFKALRDTGAVEFERIIDQVEQFNAGKRDIIEANRQERDRLMAAARAEDDRQKAEHQAQRAAYVAWWKSLSAPVPAALVEHQAEPPAATQRQPRRQPVAGESALDRQRDCLLAYSRQLRRVPTVEEALAHIKAVGAYTAPWDNPHRRRRVESILSFIGQTFDPSLCGSGSAETLDWSRLPGLIERLRRHFDGRLPVMSRGLDEFGNSYAHPVGRRVSVEQIGLVWFAISEALRTGTRLDDGGVAYSRIKAVCAMRDQSLKNDQVREAIQILVSLKLLKTDWTFSHSQHLARCYSEPAPAVEVAVDAGDLVAEKNKNTTTTIPNAVVPVQGPPASSGCNPKCLDPDSS